MPKVASFIQRPEQDAAVLRHLAEEHLRALLRHCDATDGDERFYRYHEVQDELLRLKDEAQVAVTFPQGKPRPEPEETREPESQ